MARTVFEIVYEGPAVEDSMDVRDLAPALLALGDLFELANQEIGRPGVKIQVAVKTGFVQGSFRVTLEVVQGVLEQIKTLFDLNSASNLGEFLVDTLLFGTGRISLIALVKKARGRIPKSVTVIDAGAVKLEFEGEAGQFDVVEVSRDVFRLYRNLKVWENLRKVVVPLEKDGILRLTLKREYGKRKATEIVEQHDLIAFNVPEEALADAVVSRQRMLLNVVELAFQKGYKWRFFDGEKKFTADMADEDFVRQVES